MLSSKSSEEKAFEVFSSRKQKWLLHKVVLEIYCKTYDILHKTCANNYDDYYLDVIYDGLNLNLGVAVEPINVGKYGRERL